MLLSIYLSTFLLMKMVSVPQKLYLVKAKLVKSKPSTVFLNVIFSSVQYRTFTFALNEFWPLANREDNIITFQHSLPVVPIVILKLSPKGSVIYRRTAGSGEKKGFSRRWIQEICSTAMNSGVSSYFSLLLKKMQLTVLRFCIIAVI